MKNQLEEKLRNLGWDQTAHQLDDLLENASNYNVSYFDLLHTVVLLESEYRDANLLSKRIKNAKLPYTKTIHDFDYSFQPSVSEQGVKEILPCRYIANGENRILLGPPGVGNYRNILFMERNKFISLI
ncbi:ATP-binding protein [Bacillus sp. ISL-7]|uniref:ATP-binding protein n=1 Tax=Bacillus sp. ISL-7 TaxID=2819136 RepID=UPI001BEAD3A2|nr:ATP-binding protein [Bacillus sp. ISL-7]MBT2738091.1 ATP-binding protein [Bacillus sp. ISL-7]